MGPQEQQDQQIAQEQPATQMPQEPVSQPQSAQQPQQFQPASQMFQPAPPVMGAPTPAPKKGLSKKALFGIIGGGVGLLLLIGLVLFFAIAQPFKTLSTSDYMDADISLLALQDAYGHIDPEYFYVASASSSEAARTASTHKEYLDTFSSSWDKLASSSAIKRDPELSSLFNKLKDKKLKLDAAEAAEIEAYEKVAGVMGDYYKADNTYSDPVTGLTELKAKASQVTGLNSEANKQCIKDILAWVDEILPLAEKVKAMRANTSLYNSETSSAFYKASDKLGDIADTWAKSIESQGKEASIRTELEALSTKLSEKTR